MFRLLFVALPLLSQTAVNSAVQAAPGAKPRGCPNTNTAISGGPSNPNSIRPPPSPPSGNKAMRNALYFTNWGIYAADYQPHMIPADKVTHLLYAFGEISDDGTVLSSDSFADVKKRYPGDAEAEQDDEGDNAYGCVKQLYLLKKKNRKMKTLLSVGGWASSQQGKFANMARSATRRQAFCSSAVKMVADWGMDGLDIDWEYPKDANEARQLVDLLETCRRTLDAYAAAHKQDYHYLLTVATSAAPASYRTIDMKAMDPYLDWWNLMAYDYAGSWDQTTGHQANVYSDQANMASTKASADEAVKGYIEGGIRPDKINLGLPLYGRSFANTAGPGKPYDGESIWLYRDLPRPGAAVEFDAKIGSAWSYSRDASEFVTYDTVESARFKASYVKRNGLGGAFFWEASGDKPGGDSIVGAMAESLGSLDATDNMLSYPSSRYQNIRNNMPGT